MRKLRGWIVRLGGLFHKQRQERELEDEIASHLQMHIEDNLRLGMTPEEARRRAIVQLGGIESTKEAYRDQLGLPALETLWQDVRYGARTLRKNRGFTAVAVLTLAAGIALTASTLATVNAYLVRSLPYSTAARLYHVRYAPPGPWEPRGMSSIDWKSLNDVVEDTVRSSGMTLYLMDAGSPQRIRGLRVSHGFVRGLGVQAVTGRVFAEEEFAAGTQGLAMIGYDLWRARFGSDPQVVGRQFQVTREEQTEQIETLRIVGVLPEGFWFGRDSSDKVDILTPLGSPTRTYMVRLREGVPVSFAEARITDVAKGVGSDFRPGWTGVHLQSVHDRYVENVRPVLTGITIAVGIVLVIACANVAILVLLRTLRRQKEVAVRVALGAGWTQIMRMLVSEASLVCGCALAVGLGLTTITLGALTPLIEVQLGRPAPAGPASIRMDSNVLLALGGISLVIVLSLAFIPLLSPWQRRLADSLRSQGVSTGDGPAMRRLRASLIAFEIGGSLVLLVSCGLMIRSAVNLMKTDLGFNPERVLRVGVRVPARTYADPPALSQFFTTLTERLPQVSNSRLALMTAFPPFYPANTQRFEAAGSPVETPAGMLKVGAGYFNLYEVRVIQGREFTVADRLGSEPVAVVSETLGGRLWPDGRAVGRQIRVVEGDMPDAPLGPWRTVVGVVADIRQGYDDSDLRDIYLPFLQAPSRFASVHVRTDLPISFWGERIRSAASGIDPYVLVGAAATIVSEDRQRTGTHFLTSMLIGFAVFATLLAILGIYGVTTYAVQQREREIAVRVALGGSHGAIIRMFLKQGAHVLAIGLGLGWFGAIGVAKILENRVYGVKPFDVATLIAACVVMIASGVSAIWWPARRAAMRSPMAVLKEG